jgi:hypothetical protein
VDNPQLRREECRREVRRYLAERQALAFPAIAIRRKLRHDGDDFTDEEIVAALEYLVSLDSPHVRVRPDPDGATKYYQATSAGVLAHERR